MSRYVLCVLAMLAACAASAVAQPDMDWNRIFGGEGTDKLFSLQICSIPSGLLMAGYQQANSESDANMWLIRTELDGSDPVEYIHAWDEDDVATACVQYFAGYLIGGYTSSRGSGDTDFYLERMLTFGGYSQWIRTYGGYDSDVCNAILPTSDEGCVLAGGTESYGAGCTDFWMLKVNGFGDSLWSNTFGGEDDDYCSAILPADDGGYYLAGSTESFGLGLSDFWLVKTNSNGDSLWSEYYGGPGDDWCFSAQRTADGGLILAGYTNSFGTGHTDVWLVKTDENGVHQWNHTYNGRTLEDFDGAFCVQQTTDGGYIMTGSSFYAPGQHSDIMVLRVDANGDSLWSLFYGGAGMDIGHAVQQAWDGGFLVLCYLDEPGQNAWLIKLDAEGAPIDERPLFAPRQFALSVFPNPFNPMATITFDLPRAMTARLRVFDATGRLVTTLANGRLTAGTHRLAFDGSMFPSGVYFACLQAGEYDRTEKLILLK